MSVNGNGHQNYEDFLLPPDEEVELPSGMKAVLRYPTMRYFLSISSLPSRLARAVIESAPIEDIEKADRDDALARIANEPLTTEQIEETETRSNLLLCDVFVKPRFSPNPQNGEFHPGRLRMEDRSFVLTWAAKKMQSMNRGGSSDMESFRSQSATNEVADGSVKVVG